MSRFKYHGDCRVCGRRIVVRAVRGDFSNAVFPVRHNDPSTHKECEGVCREIETLHEEIGGKGE